MQLVAPSAVRIAEAIEAMICTIHLRVSFFVISYLLSGLITALESAATTVLLGTRSALLRTKTVILRTIIL